MPTDRRAWQALLMDPAADTPPPLPASRDEALSIPAFGSGVDLLAQTIAGVPLDAYRVRIESGRWVRTLLQDQPTFLTDVDPLSDAWQWRYSVVKDLVEAGNHVSLLGEWDWRTNRAGWLVPLPVADVGLVTDTARPGWHAFTIAGVLLDPSEVLHISAGNRSGEVLGQGVIAQYAQQLGGQLAAEEWAGRYVSAGGLPPAIIQHPSIQPGEQDKADAFKGKWRALVRTGEAITLPAGAVVTPLQSDADKQQLVEARTWNAQLAAMILRIPPHRLGLPSPLNTYQNVQSADVAFIRDEATRWSNPIVYALSKWVMPAGVQVVPRWSERAITDLATQVATLAEGVAAGIITADEARQELGYPPMPAADQPPPPPPPDPTEDDAPDPDEEV